MFGPRPGMSPHNNGQPRRLSVNTIGLSSSLTSGATSQSATSPFGMGLGFTRARAESLSSSTHSGSVDESPFEDDMPGPTSVPVTPFGARRVSFGANKALGGSGGNNSGGNGDTGGGGAPTSAGRPGSSPGNGTFSLLFAGPSVDSADGYDFAERLRARAERSSVSAASYGPHHRSQSSAASTSAAAAAAAATAAAAPAQRPVAPPRTRQAPDAFQERILKGDFYLD
jgi:hypothetical protein